MKRIEIAKSVVNNWTDETRKILGHVGPFVAIAETEGGGPTIEAEARRVVVYEMDEHTKAGGHYLGRVRVTIERQDTDETTFLQAAAGALRAMR